MAIKSKLPKSVGWDRKKSTKRLYFTGQAPVHLRLSYRPYHSVTVQWWCYTLCWQYYSSLPSIWTICQKNLISLENFLLQKVPPQMPASWLRLGLVLVTGPQGGWGPGAGGCQPITVEYGEAVTNERRVLSECGALESWRPASGASGGPGVTRYQPSPKSQAERGAHCLMPPGSPTNCGD